MRRWHFPTFALLLLSACAGPVPTGEDALVLRGRIIDGTGAPAIEDGLVVVEGDRITCVGAMEGCGVPIGARLVETDGTILPGLIDLHVHTRPHYLWMYLAAGVTTVRDLNNDVGVIEQVGSDGSDRARVVWSGPLLDGENSVIARMGGRIFQATTPEAARAAVDSVADLGAEVVKLYEQIPPDAFRAAAERAAERGLPTAADLGTQLTRGLTDAEVDALQAIEAGVTSIEHLSGFALAYRRLGGDPAAARLDPVLVDSLARAVVSSGVAVVPTLVVDAAFAADALDFVDEIPLADRLPEGMGEWWSQMHAGLSAEARKRARADLRLSRALIRRIAELGGRIGAGSDAPAGPFDVPGGALHRELELLVTEGGLTPLQAITAATANAAHVLGRDDLGVVAEGKTADLLVVAGRPDEDVRETREIEYVIKGGKLWTGKEVLAMGETAPPPPGPTDEGI